MAITIIKARNLTAMPQNIGDLVPACIIPAEGEKDILSAVGGNLLNIFKSTIIMELIELNKINILMQQDGTLITIRDEDVFSDRLLCELLNTGASVLPAIAKSIPFVIGDWVADVGGLYKLDLVHNLDADETQIEVFRDVFGGPQKIFVEKEKVIDDNTLRIFTTQSPDGRFTGNANIIKIE